eukprot:TRINITY_DN16790_c0_g1_i1.p2 TRINITY_DN16790_c0_g1~~TRINITY_DN16790_c0_g1_i1.p2  ORF type:complete len:361 (+),score=135.76 TRINITY_DN16790_c0_g1_i1:96-1085(+)
MNSVVQGKTVAEVELDDLPRDSLVAKQSESVVYGMVIEGRLWALKGIVHSALTGDGKQQADRELDALRSLDHPAVPKLQRTFDGDGHRWMLMNFAPGCTLEKFFYTAPNLPVPLVVHIVAQLADTLDAVHSAGWVYRDLKANNVVLSKLGAVSLVDFGLARRLAEGERCRSPVGVRHARAPEVVRKEEYGTAVDWWGLGVLTWELLAGKPPFGLYDEEGDSGGIERRILQGIGALPLPRAAEGAPAVQSLLSGLLTADPAQRLGSGGAAQVRQHPAFTGIDWEAMRDSARWPWRAGAEAPECVLPWVEEIEEQTLGFDESVAPPQDWKA